VDGEAGAPARGAFDLDAGVEEPGHVPDDGEAEAGGGAVMLYGLLGAVVIVEDARQFVLGDADAMVTDDDHGLACSGGMVMDFDGGVVVGVMDGVEHEVFEEHGEVIRDGGDESGVELTLDLDTAESGGGFESRKDLIEGLVEVDLAGGERELGLGPEVGELEHFLDLAGEGEAAGGDFLNDGLGGIGQGAAVTAFEQLGLGVDGGEGGFELVGSLEHMAGAFLAAGFEATVCDGEFAVASPDGIGEA
jgi:hypothetical protein